MISCLPQDGLRACAATKVMKTAAAGARPIIRVKEPKRPGHVIYGRDADGDFVAISKVGSKTIETGHLKSIITKTEGTDIPSDEPGHQKQVDRRRMLHCQEDSLGYFSKGDSSVSEAPGARRELPRDRNELSPRHD